MRRSKETAQVIVAQAKGLTADSAAEVKECHWQGYRSISSPTRQVDVVQLAVQLAVAGGRDVLVAVG